jgi:hypothetical protein
MVSLITEISWRKRSDSAVTLLEEGQVHSFIETGDEMLASCFAGYVDDTDVVLRFGGVTGAGSNY